MAIRLHESGEVTIYASPGAVRPYITQLTSLPIKDLEIVSAKISSIDDSHSGNKSVRIILTLDATIFKPCETMSWIK